MSVRAHPPGAMPIAGSAGRKAVLGAVGAPVRHMLDLSAFLPIEGASWSDALISETRRHLAGCLDAVERDFRAALGGASSASAREAAWDGVQRTPQLVSSALISHMRCRAAVALLARQDGVGLNGMAAPQGEDLAWLLDDADPGIGKAAADLFRAELRWSDRSADAIFPDLPAEQHAEIVWIVAALASAGLAVQEMGTLTDVALRLTAAHDEGQAPIAQASMLARALRKRGEEGFLLGQALSHRRILLFAALAGEISGMDTATVLHALVHGSHGALAGLCHALGGSASDYRHLLLQIKVLHSDWSDSAILASADSFDCITPGQAAAALDAFRCPPELRAKLELIDPVGWS